MKPAACIVLIYLLLGWAWIVLTEILVYLVHGPRQIRLYLGISKELFFIGISALFLYYIINKYFKLLDEAYQDRAAGEERLDLVQRSVNDGVWDWDLRSGLAYLSTKYYEIVEYSPDTVVPNMDFFNSLIHADDRERVMDIMNRHLGGAAEASVFECRIITGGGVLKWILGRGKVVERDGEGQPLRMLGTITDISERKKIEQELQDSEQRYRAVVEDQTETITRYRPDGTYTFVNEVYCRLFGKTSAELLGHSWHPDAFPDDLALVKEKLQKMSPEHPVVVVENRIRSATGEVHWMQFVNRGFYGQDGQLIETQAVGRDITELKSAEAKIDRYMREVHDLYYNAPCGYHSLDADGIYVRINDTELDWLGYDRKEIIGKKCFDDLIAAECRAAFRSNFARFMEHGSIEGLEYVMIRKDGTRLSVLLSATMVKDSQGKYLMSRGVLLDITERKKAEETMRRYAHRLLEMEEDSRKKLAADLHDEIGRDLTALGLNIAMVHDYLPAEIREQVAVRLDDSRAMLEAMSRSVRGLMSELRPPVLDDYGLPAALRWHCDLFSKRSGLDIELSVGDDFLRLPTDRELALFRIAQESLTNISKHAKAHIVKVSLIEAGTMIRLSICDDGVGFDTSQAFQRQEGSCWGLTVMRERAEAANGAFYLDSAPGNGTCIMVELNRSE